METTATLSQQAALHYAPPSALVGPEQERLRPGRSEVEGLPVLWKPSPGPQTMFLESTARECMIGGAVFGGKSDALLVGALRYVYHPDYNAIILRREREDLRETIDRGRELYEACCPGAEWIETRGRFEFPSGASILMGHAQHEKDIEAYKSFEFSYIGFDELTTFTRRQYVYMLSRNRAKQRSGLPTFMRSGTNPDGEGHEWVYNRFVKNRKPYAVYEYDYEIRKPDGSSLTTTLTRQFIPSTVFDNPHAGDVEGYIAGLRSMGQHLADALLYGKWDFFRGQMFPYDLPESEPGLKQSDFFVVRALDYGWSDPTFVLWFVVYPQAEGLAKVEVVDELVVRETNVDSIAFLIRQREETQQKQWQLSSPLLSVIDPSASRSEGTSGGQNVKDLFANAGCWFTKANNDRQGGWAQIRRFLETGRLSVWKGAAPQLCDTLPKLVRDPRKADDIKPGQNDHGADTLRYGLGAVVDMEGLPAQEATKPSTQHRDPVYEQLVESLQSKNPGSRFVADGLPAGF